MADSKITALTALTAADPVNDMFPIVDVSDTTMAASGTTKKISVNNILGASGTATLASATITGDLTVRTNKLAVTSTGVGCGTTTPALPFVVSNAGAQGFEINPNGTLIAGGVDILSYNRSTSLYKGIGFGAESYLFKVGTASVTDAMTLNSTGLGIGVSPATKLDVLSASAEGTIRLTSTIDGSNASPKASSLSLRSGSSSVETARIASFNRFSNVGGGDLVFSTADTSAVLQTRATIDSSGNLILQSSATPATLATNGMLTVNATSNTNLRFSYRGSDGTTRVADITLA